MIVAALYYLMFELNHTMNTWWHHAVGDSALRHDIRSVGEGLFGGFLAQQVVWNHYRRRLAKEPGKLDRAEMALHIPNVHDSRRLSVGEVLISPVFALIYALPGFLVGYLIVKWAHSDPHSILHGLSVAVHGTANHRSLSVFDRSKTIWTQGWPQKALGLGASFFFGRRPMRGVFDDVQLWFVERRVARRKPVYWYHPATFKARYNSVASEGTNVTVHNDRVVSAMMLSLILVGGVLAAYGWYVLTYIAQP
ncbi:MAG: hypothetical protein M3256_20235 [Actinomycetota bacterium]|nr:hypothetical protein [Actinomycetota bacterium]